MDKQKLEIYKIYVGKYLVWRTQNKCVNIKNNDEVMSEFCEFYNHICTPFKINYEYVKQYSIIILDMINNPNKYYIL